MKKIDDIFKDGLDKKGLEYSDTHWANMENLLKEDKKGLLLLNNKWMLFGSLFLLLGVSTYFGFQKDVETVTTNKEEIVKSTSLENSNNSKNTVGDNVMDKENLLAKPIEIKQNTVQKDKNIDKINSKNILKAKINKPVEKTTYSLITPLKDEKNDLLENKVIESVTFNLPSLEKINEKEIIRIKDIQLENEKAKDAKKVEIASLTMVRSLDWMKPNFLNTQWQSDLTKSLDFKPIFNGFNNPKWVFYIAPFAEYMKPNSMHFSGDLESKNREESFNNTWGYGLQIAAKKKHWVFKAGLGYNSINQTTNYSSTTTSFSYDTFLTLVKRNYQTDGRGKSIALIKENIDTTEVTSTQVDCPNCAVRFEYLTVPLSMQYEARWKQFTLFGELGVKTSFLTGVSGSFSTYGTNGLKQQNLRESGDAEKIVVSGSLQAGLKIPVRQKIQFWGSYGIVRGLSSRIQSYDQKDGFTMLRFGLEYRL